MSSTSDITKLTNEQLFANLKATKKSIEDYLRGMEALAEELASRKYDIEIKGEPIKQKNNFMKSIKLKKESIIYVMKILEKHMLFMHNFYSHDSEAHKKGSCSYPMSVICCGEEQKWKYSIKELASKTLHDIELDLFISIEKKQ